MRGGSFTGRGGTFTHGLMNSDGSSLNTTLKARDVAALGENGSDDNYGLFSTGDSGDQVTLRGGSFTGRGGTSAFGISNNDLATLEAESVAALGEDGSTSYGLRTSATTNVTQSMLEGATHSVRRTDGTAQISNSRLAGGTVDGTVTCVAVSYGTTFYPGSCP